ncbi:hypothetical protein Sbal625DRAFT_1408 [Shewanella baltica OS625]|uniref:Uncharacterized protein n=1 Tax=Shewanella baltica (strain OS195) TaxID=399599 RepID=A9L5R8_SHEB9|nr:hypothetical protein [Shewanella baltica]ABX48485.1 conserved hypothetical protein [Shewanella baltica OS195]ADT93518.1 hypothetical protein Sbal678_1341 [Shewanella baltica OS678]EHC06738.1 hypothetical protein Sbal625DRAFT_1408 [Shewanella baltica OS625]
MHIQPLRHSPSVSPQKNVSNAEFALVKNAAQTSAPTSTDTVTLSRDAKQLAANAQKSAEKPAEMPALRDNIETLVELKHAKMKYQVIADMTNIATGTSQGISASTAYYLSQNEDARTMTVNQLAQQQQVNTMQNYAETTKNINEWA